jgi:hypothetical protein
VYGQKIWARLVVERTGKIVSCACHERDMIVTSQIRRHDVPLYRLVGF